jgi:regulator of protease activity HflC (stomatin/prohibitin superfamily)
MIEFIIAAVLAVVAILFLRAALRTVPQAHVMIIERLGRYHRTLQSGLNLVVPLIDKPSPFLMRTQGRLALQNHVDMREMVLGLDSEQVITRDNVGMGVGSVIYYQVIDPVKAKYEIQDVGYAIDQLTRTNLRNLMGGLTLDESLTSRDHVNVRLREVLDEASEKWGVKVTRVEIREIDPPKAIQDSMALQMQAERERRAQVTTAEGQKQAAILKAEGEKASKLLAAEGDRDAQVARAEGDRQAEILRAAGTAQAMTTQFKAINDAGVSPQILALKYIEALQSMSSGDNKVFVPYEATALLGALGSITEAVGAKKPTAAPPRIDESVLAAAAARPKPPGQG